MFFAGRFPHNGVWSAPQASSEGGAAARTGVPLFFCVIAPSHLSTLAFGFGSPWMLWGLLGVAIPIVIHLLRQRRPRVVPWAAMRFVRAAIQKRQRQIRIESWLQVLIRGALLACLAFALAEPFLERFGLTAASASATHRILVVDSSFSMGYGPHSARSFDRAREVAREIVSAARPGDAFNLARLTGHSPRVIIRRPAFDQEDVLEEVERLPLLEERGDLLASLRQIAPLLRQTAEPSRKEVIVLTDLQGETWLPANPTLRSQCGELLRDIAAAGRLTIVDVGPEAAENAAVANLSSTRSLTTPGGTLDLDVELSNFGRSARPGTRLEISVDGVVRHRETVDLPPAATMTRSVRVSAESGQDAAIEARISDDLLNLDNVRRLVVPLRRAVRVLIVDGSETRPEDSIFAELALAPPEVSTSPPVFRLQILPQTVPISRFREQALEEIDCILLCDVRSLTSEESARLETFVRGGGGLVLAMGERADSDAYFARGSTTVNGPSASDQPESGLLAARFGPPTPPLEDQQLPWSISEPESRHPITRPFDGNPDAGLLTTPIFRYRPVISTAQTPLPVDTRTVLKLSNGAPLVLERPFGLGRVVQIQTALNDRWGSWVVWPSFVPLMHEIVLFSIGGQSQNRMHLVGEPIERRMPAGGTGHPVMAAPDGSRSTLDPTEGADSRIRFDRTDASGFYQLNFPVAAQPPERYAINPDVRESALARASKESLETELLTGAKFDLVTQWQPQAADGERTEETHGKLVQPVLLLVLLLLLADLAVAGWRRGGPAGVTESR